ncbi:MAG: acyl-CoA dehydrogenase family protein, partial [Chloroflexi bacterium]|nr:acyl-CoA dehydrogenase family protein [Chloroflexota bacterium]
MLELILTDEQKALRERVRAFARAELAPMAETVDESDEVSWELVRKLADFGLFAQLVPPAFGGVATPTGGNAVSAVTLCLIREEIVQACSQADSTFAVQGLTTQPILIAGSEEQKREHLPSLARGERLGAFALTEPDAGSDVAGMRTVARLDGDEYVLDGAKKFVSNAPYAETYIVFAKTDPNAGAKGISAFVVRKGTLGFEFGPNLRLLAPHAIGQPQFRGCRVPQTARLGPAGEGFKVAMQTLDLLRASVGAAAVGLGQAGFDLALDYAKRRTAFGGPLASFQAVRFKLADMATELDAARLLVYRAALRKDRGQPRVTRESSMAKLYASEAAWR